MMPERKQFNRYTPMPGALRVFIHNSTNGWNIRDISKGGLSFQYTPIFGETIESETIDIVGSGCNQGGLINIACKLVYDICVLSEGRSFSGKEKRRRGLKLVELTETQNNMLDNVLAVI
ncbi:MAG: hypothetical protein ABIK15_07420 [Pseudomonadota bacterium]